MHAKELIKYVRHPELLTRESIAELQKLVTDFPYFQTGHILLSLAARKWDTTVYQQSIKKTAIVVNNREYLYKLINRPEAEIAESGEVQPEVHAEPEPQKKEQESASLPTLLNEVKTETLHTGKEVRSVTDEEVEKEISKSLVSAILEKEMLSEPEAHTEVQESDKTPALTNPSSFSAWLQFLKKNNGQPYHEIAQQVQLQNEKRAAKAEEKTQSEKQKKKALIDKIIETNPGAIRVKEEAKFFKSDQKAKESLLENEHLVTETLAQIYALQGQTSKAIRAYEILSLRHPQKASYYAGMIARLKNPE